MARVWIDEEGKPLSLKRAIFAYFCYTFGKARKGHLEKKKKMMVMVIIITKGAMASICTLSLLVVLGWPNWCSERTWFTGICRAVADIIKGGRRQRVWIASEEPEGGEKSAGLGNGCT